MKVYSTDKNWMQTIYKCVKYQVKNLFWLSIQYKTRKTVTTRDTANFIFLLKDMSETDHMANPSKSYHFILLLVKGSLRLVLAPYVITNNVDTCAKSWQVVLRQNLLCVLHKNSYGQGVYNPYPLGV